MKLKKNDKWTHEIALYQFKTKIRAAAYDDSSRVEWIRTTSETYRAMRQGQPLSKYWLSFRRLLHQESMPLSSMQISPGLTFAFQSLLKCNAVESKELKQLKKIKLFIIKVYVEIGKWSNHVFSFCSLQDSSVSVSNSCSNCLTLHLISSLLLAPRSTYAPNHRALMLSTIRPKLSLAIVLVGVVRLAWKMTLVDYIVSYQKYTGSEAALSRDAIGNMITSPSPLFFNCSTVAWSSMRSSTCFLNYLDLLSLVRIYHIKQTELYCSIAWLVLPLN